MSDKDRVQKHEISQINIMANRISLLPYMNTKRRFEITYDLFDKINETKETDQTLLDTIKRYEVLDQIDHEIYENAIGDKGVFERLYNQSRESSNPQKNIVILNMYAIKASQDLLELNHDERLSYLSRLELKVSSDIK